ncbi:TPA: 30S ribosomal protein S6 [bacterium]|nr:MAG: 30S ribosomal protein S6 [Candidatus Hydrogenedentes bacterium CG1_02_42_14]PIU46925.1 MAG: 30S ribosomal protein S6 [Candidatus Hydrogenedentes bacterium CG07_land_8_20_14_0_80_42_17]HBW46857.1 30S ribosomal protein S6 [bacterium]
MEETVFPGTDIGADVQAEPAEPIEKIEDAAVAEAVADNDVAVVEKAVVIPIQDGFRRYETLMILPSRYEGTAFDEIIKEIHKVMESNEAKIVRTDLMGRRALAYTIQKQKDGVYANVVFDAPPSAVKSVERGLKLHGSIIRFLTTGAIE